MEFYEVLKQRKSIRKYKPDPVSDDILNRILEAGRGAPSAKNIQPWHFIVVRNQKTKEQLIDACRGQRFIAQADVILCGCSSEKIAWGRMGGYMSAFAIDLTIAFEHMILAAANEGLATCWIGAFEEKKVKKILNVPDDVRVVALTPIGYAAEEAKDRGRKPLAEIVSYEKYG
ncbi:nitroreductase [candidate division WOR_3 bacterium SM23_60]|uniref:Nitroreductase n=1 Tax=candidate division WOR_3 bacterium SM23_60 TaxID=1703780 RepID=A0A0S8GJ97_UNCW3|nr:MAG: nitroreductase [candidate division WOR_3 bacterium SM23_60]